MVFEGRAYARILGPDILKTYTMCGVWTISLWCLYPIAWGLSEGGNVIPSDSEAIFYGVLDLLAKRKSSCYLEICDILTSGRIAGFGALLLWGHRNIEVERLGLHIRDPETTPGQFNEKTSRNGVSTGVSNGHCANNASVDSTSV